MKQILPVYVLLLLTLEACNSGSGDRENINSQSRPLTQENVLAKMGDKRCLELPFSGGDFHNCNLSGINLEGKDLSNINFEDAKLVNANLNNTILTNANFTSANLKNAKLESANLQNANLSRAKLQNVHAYQANMKNTDLSSTNFSSAVLNLVNFANAKFHKTKMYHAHIEGAMFSFALDLQKIDLRGANINEAFFLVELPSESPILNNALTTITDIQETNSINDSDEWEVL